MGHWEPCRVGCEGGKCVLSAHPASEKKTRERRQISGGAKSKTLQEIHVTVNRTVQEKDADAIYSNSEDGLFEGGTKTSTAVKCRVCAQYEQIQCRQITGKFKTLYEKVKR